MGSPHADELSLERAHSEFANNIAKEFAEFFASFGEIEAAVEQIFRVPAPDLAKRLCRHLAKMVANSFSSVVLLGTHGFGNDAMKVVRSMFEASITVAHLSRHEGEAEDYFEYRWIVQHHRLEYMREFAPELLEGVNAAMIERTERELNRVLPRFARRDGTARPTWSRQPLSQLAAGVGRSHEYDLLYGLGSDIQHAGIAAILAQIDPDPEVLDADISPSRQWVPEAFISAHAQTVVTLTDYVDFAFPDKKPLTAALLDRFERIWKRSPIQLA